MMKQMHHKERERLERERDREREREKERERLKDIPEVPAPMQPVIKQEIVDDVSLYCNLYMDIIHVHRRRTVCLPAAI